MPASCIQDHNGRFLRRDFSPAFCGDALRERGVRAVIRLNAAEYAADAFAPHGLLADLPGPALRQMQPSSVVSKSLAGSAVQRRGTTH